MNLPADIEQLVAYWARHNESGWQELEAHDALDNQDILLLLSDPIQFARRIEKDLERIRREIWMENYTYMQEQQSETRAWRRERAANIRLPSSAGDDAA